MKQISFFGRSSVPAAFALTNGRPSADRRVRYGMNRAYASGVGVARSVGDPSGIRRERSVFGPWSKWCRIAAVGLLLLTIGVGNVWGAETVYKTALFGSDYNKNNSSYTSSFDATNDAFVVTVTNFNNNNNGWTNSTSQLGQIKCGRQNNASVGAITTKEVIDKAITKVVVTVDAFTNDKVNSFKVYVATDATFTKNLQTITKTIATGANTFSVETPTANCYYKVEINCKSGTSNGLVTISKVEYYKAQDTPSYTITAASDNTSYGTVSLSGTIITGSPKSGYRYADPAYSVSPVNSAIVSQDGDAFTVTPSANTTVTINFEAIPTHTLNYHDGSGNGSRSNVYEGTNLITALGTPAASCDATSTTFVGWATSEIAAKTNTAPTFVAADAVVNATTAAATYYAVYAKAGSAGTPVNVFSVNVQCINDNISLSGYSKMIGTEWSNPNRQDGNSYNPAYIGFYRATKLFSSVPTTITATAYLAGGTAKNPLSNSVYAVFLDASGNEIAGSETVLCSDVSTTYEEKTASMPTAYAANAYGLKIRHAKETGFNVRYQSISLSYTNITYTHYMTTCCESLGEIKGSVSLSQLETPVEGSLEASWQLAGTTGIGSLNLELWKKGVAPASDTKISTESVTINTNAQNKTFTDLDHCATYYVKLIAAKDADTYCTDGWTETSNEATTIGYAITLPANGKVKDGEKELGTVAASKIVACENDEVTLTATPTNPYTGGLIVVRKTIDNTDVTSSYFNQGTKVLKMPAFGVTVSATFTAPTEPSLSVSGEALDETTLAFGEQEVGVLSTEKSFTLTGANLTGDVSWALSGTDASDFSVSVPTSTTIAKATAESGQTITVAFRPSSTGAQSATLTFTSENATKVIALTGTGVNLYTVTFDNGTGTNGTTSAKQISAGGSVALPTPTLSDALGNAGWSFAGWKKESAVTSITTEKPTLITDTYTPTSNEALYAVYKFTEGGGNYELVESDLGTAWAGDYLIAYSSTIFADGRLGGTGTGGIGADGVKVDPSTNLNGKIVAASWGDIYNVTLEEITSGSNTYVLKTKDGNYNYQSSNASGITSTSNKSMAELYPITITFTSSSDIKLSLGGDASGAVFRYNSSTNNGYFRFYKDGGQNAIYLYKKGSPVASYFSNPSDKVTITYDANGGENAPGAQENITIGTNPTVAAAGTMAKAGHTFSKWNTKADGTGTDYAAGATITDIKKDVTLYAVWTVNIHKVSVSSVDHGTITATPAGVSAIAEGANNAAVAYGTVVTLTQTNDTHYTFGDWTVTKNGDAETVVAVSEGSFTMPDYDVVVSANFTENAKRDVVFYSNGEQVGAKVTTYVGEAPASAPTAVYESCLEGSNIFYGWTNEQWDNTIDDLTGKTVYRTLSAIPNVTAGTGDVEYYAVWAKGSEVAQSYVKGTSADLKSGQVVVLVNPNGSVACKNSEHSSGALNPLSLTISGDNAFETANADDDASVRWTVAVVNGKYQFKSGNNYLNATGENALYCNTTSDTWSLSAGTVTGTYVFTSTNCSKYFQYYSNQSKFTTYKNSGVDYDMHIYVPEVTYSDFRTNCCSLKPVTGLAVNSVSQNSVTLSWTAPASTDGITELQVVNAENGGVLKSGIAANATGAEVTGLVECNTYNLKVVSVGDACSSNSTVVVATPQNAAKTVSFKFNDGVTADVVESTTCSADYVAVPADPTRSGYLFMGWYNGETEVTGATFEPEATATIINATWAQLYTVHYDFDDATSFDEPDDVQYIAGESVELTAIEPNKGVLAPFKAWDYSVAVSMIDETHFTMPASDVTITATYNEIEGQWILVTDESSLSAGDYVIIAAASTDRAISTTQNSNNRGTAGVTKSGSTLSAYTDEVQIFVLEEGAISGTWAFKCLNGESKNKYIYAASTSANHLKTREKIETNGAASWTIGDAGKITITANLEGGHNLMQYNYNNNNQIFSAYNNAQSDGDIALYQFREGTFYDVNMPAVAPTGGSVSANTSMAKAGETVTLTYTPSRGYTVETLTVTGASGSVAISPAVTAGVKEYTFTMPAEAVTVAASFAAVPPVVYTLVEDADDLAVGMQFVMLGTKADGTDPYVIGEMNNSNRLAGDAVATSSIDAVNKTLSLTTEAAVDFTLEGEPSAFKIKYNGSFVKAGSNSVSWDEIGDAWNITISEGKATITFNENKLQYNPGQHWVAAYTSTGQLNPALYALPYTTYNFTLNGCKTIKVATGYTYTYKIKSSDVPSVIPEGYEFLNKWTDGTNIYAVGDEVVVSAAKILEPCWKVTPTANVDINDLPATVTEIVVTEGKTLTVDADKVLDNLTVEAGGEVEGSSELVVLNNLTIESEAGKSGQVIDVTNVSAANLYLDITLREGAMDAAAARLWYCISAPFNVNMAGGFFWGDGTPMVLNQDFQLFEYDGRKRATTGVTGWQRVGGVMKAGVAYLIGFDDENPRNQSVIRLKAMSAALPDANAIALGSYTGDAANSNWNGIANPTLHYIGLDQSVQAFNYETQSYAPYDKDDYNFVVGTPFFIQATGSISIEDADKPDYRAPRAQRNESYRFRVQVSKAGASRFDNQVYVRASEDATATFQTGRDMVSFNGTTSQYGALLWTENYGTRLAIEDAPLVNGQAQYSLGLSAPAAGTYVLSQAGETEGATLYLTHDGNIIWNLSAGAYEATLQKGVNSGYGLRLVVNPNGVATGMDGYESEADGAEKVLLDGVLYILRGGRMYDATGKAVR